MRIGMWGIAVAIAAVTAMGAEPNPKLRAELIEMRRADQASRNATPLDPEAVRAVDKKNTQRVKEIVEEYGWPTVSLVGEAGANCAFVLVQHADADPAFQKDVLKKMEPLLGSRELNGGNYAFLFDRVAMNDGRPQRFGTQGRCSGANVWQPRAIDDPDHVDERRAAAGLDPLADYVAMMSSRCK